MPSPKPQRHRRYRRWRDSQILGELCRLCLKKFAKGPDGQPVGLPIFNLAQELDHYPVPLSLGGALMDESNVRPLCRQCHHDHHNGRSVEAPAP